MNLFTNSKLFYRINEMQSSLFEGVFSTKVYYRDGRGRSQVIRRYGAKALRRKLLI